MNWDDEKCPFVMPGDRVECMYCTHLHEHVAKGTKGTVVEVKLHGAVVVTWDDGSERWLMPGEDGWKVL